MHSPIIITAIGKRVGLELIHNASEWITDDSGDSHSSNIEKMMKIHVSIPYQLNMALKENLIAYNGLNRDIIHIRVYVVN